MNQNLNNIFITWSNAWKYDVTFILLNYLINHLIERTISSIFKIILTHSVAKVKALWVTKAGWITFSLYISSAMLPFFTLMPQSFAPFACLFLNSVTTLIGFNPAFSDKVYGIISSDSA